MIILSGIIEEQAPECLEAVRKNRLTLIEKRQVKDWVTLLCQRGERETPLPKSENAASTDTHAQPSAAWLGNKTYRWQETLLRPWGELLFIAVGDSASSQVIRG